MRSARVAIMISGQGSNMEALINACRAKDFPAEVALVISSRPKAKGLELAKKAKIPTKVIDHTKFETRDAFEAAIQEALKAAGVDLICLAGFMRVLNPSFVHRWRDRMLNIHPSLLPAFKGLHTHERVLEAGARFTGCTVHFVRPEMDSGPIIIQAAIAIAPDDTAETIGEKVLEFEHQIYPEALRMVAEGRVRVSGNIVQIKDGQVKTGGIINPAVS